MVILLVTLFAISFFVTLNYRDISNKRYIRKRLKNLKVGESIIIPTEYHVFGIFSHREVFDSTDDGLWNSGNYFRTEDEARKYVNEFKRMLQERTLDKEE